MPANDKHIADRYAFFLAYERLCAYCREPLRFDDFEIEHIIPRRLREDSAEWQQVLQTFGLPEDFDVESDSNRMAACGRCNRRKAGELLPNVGILLNLAEKKVPQIRHIRDTQITDRQRQKLLADIQRGLDQDASFRQDLYSRLRPDLPAAYSTVALSWPNDASHRRAKELLGAASGSLLTWPQTTDGHWFERVESDKLSQALSSEGCRLIAIVGPPGSGKSSLLARLGSQLAREGHALLALKADLMPPHIASIRALDAWLNVPESLPVILERLAIDGPVTILLDQLDALSELMDVHTERLFALIALINRVLLSPGVRVVLSCREFDAQHDLRLRNIIENDHAKKLELSDIGWSSVEQFLRQKSFQPDSWPGDVKRILCRPNALKLFVKYFQPNSARPVFDTYQSMLEQILQQSVVRPFPAGTVTALYALADELANREELWLPRAEFENSFQQEINRLQAAGWIQATPDGRRLGFAHQTMFDFTRARSFISRHVDLFEEVERRQDSLAIRPVLWSAASYLRIADPARYSNQIGAVLQSSEIRPHIKILLVEFLGTLANPSHQEAAWLKELLSEEKIRPHLMHAIAKRSAWFALLRTDLVACGQSGPEAAYQVSWVFNDALRFDQLFVLDAIQNSWLKKPELDYATFNVFRNFEDWDKPSAAIVERVVSRTSFGPMWVCKIAQSMAKGMPRAAVGILRLQLDHDLEQARLHCSPRPEKPGASASVEEAFAHHMALDRSIEPLTRLLRNHGEWYELTDVAATAPAELIEGLWTWVEAISAEINGKREMAEQGYREIYEWRFGQEFGSYFAQALWSAAQSFAETYPDRFMNWVEQSSQSEWMPVHQLIVHGLIAIASKRSKAVLGYLLADSRRLGIETSFGDGDLSRKLIASLAPVLPKSDADLLKAFINVWRPFNAKRVDSQSAAEVEHWNEEARSQLFSAMHADGSQVPSTQTAERNDDEDSSWELMKTPVNPDDMAKLSDPEVVALLSKYPDSRQADITSHQGGAELAITFGEFAKKNAARAVSIVEQLKPGIQEKAAAQGLDAIAKSELVEPHQAIKLARELRERGFSSDEFRSRYGWAMVGIANRTSGLAEDTIDLLLTSLQVPQQPAQTSRNIASEHASPVFRHQEKKQKRKSILWDHQGGVLPDGNFPILLAITLGLLRRKLPDYEQLLKILEMQLTQNEDPAVWQALLHYLRYLAPADRTRSLKIVKNLLQDFPQIFSTVEGVRFVASSHEWFPPDLFEAVLRVLETSEWEEAQGAIGELLLLRVALTPEDEVAQQRLKHIVEPSDSERGELQLGIVRSAAETWAQPRLRDISHSVLVRFIPNAAGDFGEAIMLAFSARDDKRLPCDRHTSEILAKVAELPTLLQVSAIAYLIDRLKELLEDNYSPTEVAKVALAIVETNIDQIRNMSGRLSTDTEDLLNIAITLQRFPETRAYGTSIFEHLLIVNAYKVSETAKEVDRRF